jgi:hypothetical protein
MIDRTLSNALAVADIAPKAATKLPEPSQGDNGFGEALAGAHTVHDRRESQAASHSRREWAHGDHAAERTRGQDRADEVRNDHADAADDVDEPSFTPTGEADDVHDVDADSDSDVDTATATGTEVVADATAEGAASLAATATAGSTDQDAVLSPTTTAATSVATDAVDAAMRLAIDADVAPADADAAVDVDAQLTAALTGTEDAETGDVEGPTRPRCPPR